MSLNRGTLAKIDAKLRSEMEHDEEIHLVKVPVSEAVWSTWRRYCDLASISMGRALAILLHNELASIAEEDLDELEERIRDREGEIETRATKLKAAERVLAAERRELLFRAADLDERERDLKGREDNVGVVEHNLAQDLMTRAGSQPGAASSKKPGRNDPCWCGSGKKYKNCHGKPRIVS